MTIPLAIVAHPDRTDTVSRTSRLITADVVIWDDVERGCTANHRMAWEYHADTGVSDEQWAVVIEDDALPVGGFRDQLQKVLQVAPTEVVSLYLGTGTPPQWQDILRTSVNPFAGDPNFLLASELLSCVGYALQGRHVEPVINVLKHTTKPVDEAITGYLKAHDLTVAYTRPSIVNHLDGPPLVSEREDGLPRTRSRRAWKFGRRARWTSESVVLEEPKLVKVDDQGRSWYEKRLRVVK